MKIKEPFVLRKRIILPSQPSPSGEHRYDHNRQIWVNIATGNPVVNEDNTQKASRFGETSITETREGIDQTEVSALNSSRFGETSITKSNEGHDQSESVLASKFGETSLTRASEGHDPHNVTSSITKSHAPHYHF